MAGTTPTATNGNPGDYLGQLQAMEEEQRAFSLAAAKMKALHDTIMDIIRKIA